MRLLALALPFIQLSLAATYTINHRLLQSHSEPDAVFQKYGTISIPDDHTSNILRIDRSEGAGASQSLGQAGGEGWYQVLVTGEDLGEGIMSSTKTCYLQAGAPSIILHRHNYRLNSVEIVPHSSIPTDGSCPQASNSVQSASYLQSEVTLKEPHQVFGHMIKDLTPPYRPDLAPPIPVTTGGPGGGPAPPAEEKSFLQKYWLPLLGVGFFVVSQLAPDDKAQPAAAPKN